MALAIERLRMQLDIFAVLSSLTGLFLLIGVGYGAVKLRVLPVTASAALSAIVLKISLPCTVFLALLRPYDPAFLGDMLMTLLLGAALVAPTAALSLFAVRLCRVRPGHQGMWAFCATFCNNVFMAYPVVRAIFGDDGLTLAAVFGIPYTVLIYTLGGWMISRDLSGAAGRAVEWRKLLCTGINAAAVLGMFCYLARLSPPEILLTPVTYISNLTTPLSMFVTGMNLTAGTWRENFQDRDALSAAFVRLIPLPLAALALLKVVQAALPSANPLIFGVSQIVLSMPTAAVATILAETYQADRRFAAREVFLSSLFCIVTIPVMAMLI